MANPFTFELPMSSLVIKYSLFAWNFLLFILGIVLIAAGFSVATEYATSGDGLSELINNKYISLPIFIGVIGIMISLITFFGCYGSIKESMLLTSVYAGLLGLLMITLFIGGIVGYAYRDSVDGYVGEMLAMSMKNWCNHNQGPWQYAQTHFECCGIKSPKDWVEESEDFKYWSKGYFELEMVSKNPGANLTLSATRVPDSCCNGTATAGCGLVEGALIYDTGCLSKIEDNITSNLVKVAGAAIGISIFSLLVIVVTYFLAKQYSKKQEHYRNMST